MIKRFIVIVALFSAFWAKAQENTSSPYSYYGVGITNFKGTVENRAMGGLSTFSDSIHMNLTNPAGYGKLARTTYVVGASVESTKQETQGAEDRTKNVSLDYLGLGVPVGRFGFGVGLNLCFTSATLEPPVSSASRSSAYLLRSCCRIDLAFL